MRSLPMALLLLLSSSLMAKDYGLIVSISKYNHIERTLDVSQDVERYENILKKMGFSGSCIYLKEGDATRVNILQEVKNISQVIKKDDRFFMFFTGHGINEDDEDYGSKLQEGELAQYITNSGAILPVDFNPKDISNTVIIGKRDLRKYFTKIDKITKKILIVFDTCYSKESVKGENREDKLELLHIDTKDDEYPYENIVYISASKSKAKPGKLSKILDSCIEEDTNLTALKLCMNEKSKKSPYKPVILSKNSNPKVFEK